MRRFVCIRYFWGLLYLRFTGIKIIEKNIEVYVKDTRGIEGIKIGRISGKRCVSKTSWYLALSVISNKVSSISLLRFWSVSIIGV